MVREVVAAVVDVVEVLVAEQHQVPRARAVAHRVKVSASSARKVETEQTPHGVIRVAVAQSPHDLLGQVSREFCAGSSETGKAHATLTHCEGHVCW